jgi:hypothetical protein
MMMRTVFSLSLLILPVSMVVGAEQAATKSDADFATLVRNHGFVNPALVQNADEATVGESAAAVQEAVEEASAAPAAEATVESPAAPMPVADSAVPTVDSESGYQAPIRHQHHHYSAPQRRSSRGGVFSELMELERRKNAWLKRTFLGR